VRPSHRAPRLGVVGGTIRVAEPIAADGPRAEADRAHGQAGAAEHPPLHPSTVRSASGVVSGSEHVVPTHTVAAGRSAVFRTTSLRGRKVGSTRRCMAHAAPFPRGPCTSIRVAGWS